jgi:DNA-binding GntR family transcriptional regulator
LRGTFSALDTEPLREKAYQRIKKAIIGGRFKPGETITIRGAAEGLGTSATPVREALRQLVAERVLEIRSNRSVAVPVMTSEKFEELVEIRSALEGMAAHKAARRITGAQIERLRRLNEEMAAAVERGDVQRYLSLNEEFHFTIYRAARSPVLLSIVELLWLQIGPFLNHLFSSVRPSGVFYRDHDAAVEALSRRDGAAAGQALRDDIRSSIPQLALYVRKTADARDALAAEEAAVAGDGP